MQLRAYERTREAMRSEKGREADAKWATTQSPMAQLVAKVQFMAQRHLTPEDMEEE
jgi:hypothetical protein